MFNFGGGQLPSFGRPQMGGQQQMRPLGQMWQQPPGQMQPMGQQGQLPSMGDQQQTPGMVPGVPGSVGLNPGMGGPIQGQMQGGFTSRLGGVAQMIGQMGSGNMLQNQFAGHHGNGFGQFMQSQPFQTMMQSPEAQSFLQGNPQFQRYLSRGQQPNPIMRPMGA